MVIRVEFKEGVPIECVEWLWANVGPGNLMAPAYVNVSFNEYAWFYERVLCDRPPSYERRYRYTPTITVKDEKLGMLFALRWQNEC